MICRMPSFLCLAGLFLFRLILVVLVVGDALVSVLEEMLCKLLDLGFAEDWYSALFKDDVGGVV